MGRPRQQSQQQSQTGANRSAETLQPVERAARTVAEVLSQEAQYPELDNYIGRGCSIA